MRAMQWEADALAFEFERDWRSDRAAHAALRVESAEFVRRFARGAIGIIYA